MVCFVFFGGLLGCVLDACVAVGLMETDEEAFFFNGYRLYVMIVLFSTFLPSVFLFLAWIYVQRHVYYIMH